MRQNASGKFTCQMRLRFDAYGDRYRKKNLQIYQLDKLFNQLCVGLEALGPESLVGQVDARDLRSVLDGVDGGGVEELFILGTKAAPSSSY